MGILREIEKALGNKPHGPYNDFQCDKCGHVVTTTGTSWPEKGECLAGGSHKWKYVRSHT